MSKNIALFIDGTWEQQGVGPPTNVQRLHALAQAQDAPGVQVTHYLRGVGTNAGPFRRVARWQAQARLRQESPHPAAGLVRTPLGGITGLGLSSRIREAYAFLVAHYEPGDRLYLFGFSRGAFAVRSLAGFIDTVGLLLRAHLCDVEAAWRLYASEDEAQRRRLARFLRRLTGAGGADAERGNILPIHLIGVWDTVAALGLPGRLQRLTATATRHHRTGVPSNVTHARHALALHEFRRAFEPLLWDGCAPGQSLQQVWFAGAHGDVGGGLARTDLSDVALRWMADEARALGLRLGHGPAASPGGGQAVHDSLRRWFALASPRVRRFLGDVTRADPAAARARLAHHAVHTSAARRLVDPEATAYDFRPAVTGAMRRADNLSAELAWRLARLHGRWPVGDGGVPFADATPSRSTLPAPSSPMTAAEVATAGEPVHAMLAAPEADLPLAPAQRVRALLADAVFGGEAALAARAALATTLPARASERIAVNPADLERVTAHLDAVALALADAAAQAPGTPFAQRLGPAGQAIRDAIPALAAEAGRAQLRRRGPGPALPPRPPRRE